MGKGSAFERAFSKELSLWWTEGERDDIFWRSSNSGGRATVRAAVGKTTSGQYGDVAAIDASGIPFLDLVTIELKKGYSKFTIQDIFDCKPYSAIQKWEEWFSQTRTSAINAGSVSWFMVTERDRREALLYMPTPLFHLLEKWECFTQPRFPRLRFNARLRTDTSTNIETDISMLRWWDWKEYALPRRVSQIEAESLLLI
jgi:hypothetical protein